MKRALLAMLLLGCSVDADPNGDRCTSDADCGSGRTCTRPMGLSDDEPGFCVGGGMDAPADAGPLGDAGCVPLPDVTDDCTNAGVDDDCDLAVDEDADFTSSGTCGNCETACADGTPLCRTEAGESECVAAGMCGALEMCPDGCVDTQTSENHCGQCLLACDTGEACVMGECRCDSGEDCGAGDTNPACCMGECTDLDDDPMNCGGCNRACPDSRQTCTEGGCFCGSEPCAGPCCRNLRGDLVCDTGVPGVCGL